MAFHHSMPVSMLLDDLNRPCRSASKALFTRSAHPRYRTSSSAAGDVTEVELPGVEKSNVSLDVKGKTLRIVAKRMMNDSDFPTAGTSCEAPVEEKSNANAERAPDAVRGDGEGQQPVDEVKMEYDVRFSLGRAADTDRISADMKNGLLRVRVPTKAPQAPQVQKISVR